MNLITRYLLRIFINSVSYSLLQAMERLPVLTEEILRIGSDTAELQSDDTSGRDAARSSSDSDQTDIVSQEKKVKSIEEYQRPLAVMGVSVL